MTDGPIIDPDVLALAVDTMTWAQLERSAKAVLAGLALVVESAGAQRKDVRVARPHPESAPPASTPLCPCGCPSRRDHWAGRLAVARDRDVEAAGGWDDLAADAQIEPTAFRHAVFQAAEELRLARTGPRDRGRTDGQTTTSGPERADFICQRYAGFPSSRAAYLESLRAGPIDRAAIRRCRSRSGLGLELGEPRLADDGRPLLPEEIDDQIVTLSRLGHSPREIAQRLDMGSTTVERLLPDLIARAQEREAQAA